MLPVLLLGLLSTACGLDVETSYLDFADAVRSQQLQEVLGQRPFPEAIKGGTVPEVFPFSIPENGTIWEATFEKHADVALFAVAVEYAPEDLEHILEDIEAFFSDYDDTTVEERPEIRSWRSIDAGFRIDLTSTEDRLRMIASYGAWSPPPAE